MSVKSLKCPVIVHSVYEVQRVEDI